MLPQPYKNDEKLIIVRGYNTETGIFNYMQSGLLFVPRPDLTEEEYNDYFPFRLILSDEQKENINRYSQENWDSICIKCGMCCMGMGVSKENNEPCCYKAGDSTCVIYNSEDRKGINCSDIKKEMLMGIFPWTAYYHCSYWTLFSSVTGVRISI